MNNNTRQTYAFVINPLKFINPLHFLFFVNLNLNSPSSLKFWVSSFFAKIFRWTRMYTCNKPNCVHACVCVQVYIVCMWHHFVVFLFDKINDIMMFANHLPLPAALCSKEWAQKILCRKSLITPLPLSLSLFSASLIIIYLNNYSYLIRFDMIKIKSF